MSFSITDYLNREFNIQLHEQQKEALDAVQGPVLLLAVPGAGKTTVMVARIAHMIANCGIAPENILTITFSKASAADMRLRYEKLFAQLGWTTPQFSTIHAFCYRVLRSYCRMTGGQLPELLENKSGNESRSAILREIYSRINHEFLSEDLEEELQSHLSLIKNAMLTQEEVAQQDTVIPNLWKIYEAYSDYKRAHNLMDYDDMLRYAYNALRKSDTLLDGFRKKFPYICVDEAQDTSLLQHRIIQLLAAPLNNLFMVGDEDQSIYGFRGAHPQTLLDFQKIYPSARILKMEENFRSSRSIVDRAAVFIAQNQNRYDKKMHTAAEQGLPIESPELRDLSQQYQLVADTLRQQSGSIAVIYRKNISAVPLADFLVRKGIDFKISGSQKSSLRGNSVVSDVLSFLSLSYDRSNLQAFTRICTKTSARISRSMLQEMNTSPLASGESWFERVTENDDSAIRRNRAIQVSALIDKLKDMRPERALHTIMDSIGYLDYLEYRFGLALPHQKHKLSVLIQLAERVPTVEDFIQRIDDMDLIIRERSAVESSRLTLTTVHGAKGLEYDTVILIDLVEDIFPIYNAVSAERKGDIDGMDEEARLFYVACTRARTRLIVPHSQFASDLPVEPSRFIDRLLRDPLIPAGKTAKDAVYPGLRVLHPSFGEGQIMSVDRKEGRIVCFFKESGTRTLSMEYLDKLSRLS